MKIKILSILILGAFPIVCHAAGAAATGTIESIRVAGYARGKVEINADLEKIGAKSMPVPKAFAILHNDAMQTERHANTLDVAIRLVQDKLWDLQREAENAAVGAAGAAAAAAAPSTEGVSIEKQMEWLNAIGTALNKKLASASFQKEFLLGLLPKPADIAAPVPAAAAAGAGAADAGAVAPRDWMGDIRSTLATREAMDKPPAKTFASKIVTAKSEADFNELIAHVEAKIKRYRRLGLMVQKMTEKDPNFFTLSTERFPHVARSKAFQAELRKECEISAREFQGKVFDGLSSIFATEAALVGEMINEDLKAGAAALGEDVAHAKIGVFVQTVDGRGTVCKNKHCILGGEDRATEYGRKIEMLLRLNKKQGATSDISAALVEMLPPIHGMVNSLVNALLAAVSKSSGNPDMLGAASLEYTSAPIAAIAGSMVKWEARLKDLQDRKRDLDLGL